MNKILIVDDIKENRKILASIIKNFTDNEVFLVKDGQSAIDFVKSCNVEIDLILLDIMMPGIDGYEVSKKLKEDNRFKEIPIIFITALNDSESRIKAFKEGGADYISKPFERNELLARIDVHLGLKRAKDELKGKNIELTEKNKLLASKEAHLQYLVDKKTRTIEEITITMVSMMETANYYNDDDTGNHIRRVSEYCEVLAKKLGYDEEFVKRIKLFAPLHDVGKVGIPDKILKKPGKLTKEEWEVMQSHVDIGFKMLSSQYIDEMAKNIALYHHEKWDGSGYLNSKKGEEIPIEARIVAISDVYDALTHERVYKKAFSQEKTEAIIKEGRGTHFDPKVVDAFFNSIDEILKINKRLS